MLQVNLKSVCLNDKSIVMCKLSNIEFELPPSSIYSILGKNGEGKSILVKCLTRLLSEKIFSTQGKVSFEDIDLLSIPENELVLLRQKKIKYVFQDAGNLFDPLRELNYYFTKVTSAPESEIHSLLADLLLPEYSELNHKHSYELSIGQLQRLAFCLALLAQPKILILDEPTSALDVGNGNIFLLQLKKFVTEKGGSVLLVTQDIMFAYKASDKIAYLENGTLTEFFTVDEFSKNHPDNLFIKTYEMSLL